MKILIDKAQRLWKMPQAALGPMKFARKRLTSRGVGLIDLGSIAPELMDKIVEPAARPANIFADKEALAGLKRKIVEKHLPLSSAGIDPEKELAITPGIGMTASLLTLSTLNPGDTAACPDPGPQYFRTAICLADAIPCPYPLAERNDYIPNISSLTEPPERKLKMLFLNYPHNPTTSSADFYFYRDLLRAINFENILVVSDCAYIHPGDRDAVSILQAKGAKKMAVELHSFSTTFGIDGLGFAVGHRDVIATLEGLLEALEYIPDAYRVQLAATALDRSVEIFDRRSESLKGRRETAAARLKELGWRIRAGEQTPFMWVRPTAKSSSLAFSRRLITKAGVRLAPGTDFGEAGEGWQRLTLHPDRAIMAEALERISNHSRLWQRKYRPKG